MLLERFYRRNPTLGRCWLLPLALPLISVENPAGEVPNKSQIWKGLHNFTDFALIATLHSPKLYLLARSIGICLLIARGSTLSVLSLRLTRRRSVGANILRQRHYSSGIFWRQCCLSRNASFCNRVICWQSGRADTLLLKCQRPDPDKYPISLDGKLIFTGICRLFCCLGITCVAEGRGWGN